MALVLLLTSLSRLADGIPCPKTSCPDVTALSFPVTAELINECDPFLAGTLNPSPPKLLTKSELKVPLGPSHRPFLPAHYSYGL